MGSEPQPESDPGPHELLPGWITERMMSDCWEFGLLLVTGHVLIIECIDTIYQDAAGDIWLDVAMLGRENVGPLTETKIKLAIDNAEVAFSPTDRIKATVAAKHVIAAFEVATS